MQFEYLGYINLIRQFFSTDYTVTDEFCTLAGDDLDPCFNFELVNSKKEKTAISVLVLSNWTYKTMFIVYSKKGKIAEFFVKKDTIIHYVVYV